MSALALAILIVASDANDPSTTAAIDAARGTLGEGSRVRVETFAGAPTSEDIAAASAGADAAVVLTWEPDHRRAHLHLWRPADRAWIDRDIAFDPRDAPKERGRTIGFALATMMPEPPVAWAPAVAPPAPPPTAIAREKPDETHAAPSRQPSLRTLAGAVTAAGVGALSLGGYGGGGGGVVGAEWYFVPRVGVRVSFSARASDVGPVAASAYVLSAGVGPRFVILQSGAWEVGARTELLLMWEQVSHLDSDDASTQRQARFLPGALALADVGWSFTDSASVALSAGAEVAFGQTDLYLRGQRVAALVPARLVSELGFRLRF